MSLNSRHGTRKLVKISKYLSRHLRHAPERIGLALQDGGWIEVETLLKACANNRFAISRDELNEVVAGNDKQRFAFNESGTRIRASQGHSVEVNLGLEAQAPPAALFHGTAKQNVASILERGLEKRARHHVHLSRDEETARGVGSRHGVPVILKVDAATMHAAGHEFFCSANGVWLASEVPPQFLQVCDE